MRHAVLASLILLAGCGAPPEGQADPAEAPAAGTEPEMAADRPDAAPESTPDDAPAAESCAAHIGDAAAQELADRCVAVSPATHPPCNVQNSCEMIQDEIDRACSLFADDSPAECAAE